MLEKAIEIFRDFMTDDPNTIPKGKLLVNQIKANKFKEDDPPKWYLNQIIKKLQSIPCQPATEVSIPSPLRRIREKEVAPVKEVLFEIVFSDTYSCYALGRRPGHVTQSLLIFFNPVMLVSLL